MAYLMNSSDLLSTNGFSFNQTEQPGTTHSYVTATPASWVPEIIAEYVVRSVLFLMTFLVNLLVLVAIATTPSLRCPTHLVIGSLAMTDLIVGVAGPPGLLVELQIIVLPSLCRFAYAFVIALCSVSINHLLFVSVDRYLLISRPLHYVQMVTKKRAIFFIMACWFYALAVSLLYYFGVKTKDNWTGACTPEFLFPVWFLTLLTLMHFILPLVIMMYVHTAIFVVARRQQNAVQTSFKQYGSPPERDRMSTSLRLKLRSARLLALPCGYFHLSWGPWFIAMMWAVISQTTIEPHEVANILQALAMGNSLGNPILYAVSQPLLGKAMLRKLSWFCGTGWIKKRVKTMESTRLVSQGRSQITSV